VEQKMRDIAERAQETGEYVGNKIKNEVKTMKSSIKDLDINESTIPDAFRGAPKFISPRVHSWLDAATTAYFLVLGVVFAAQGKKGPAAAAFINGGMVGSVSMMTDYDGDGGKPISFKMHGTLDAVQATTAALAPVLHGFSDEKESAFFYGQAVNEAAVIASTDWDEGMPARRYRRAA
jgi:hypothetical protein